MRKQLDDETMSSDVRYNKTLQIIEIVHTGVLTSAKLELATDHGLALHSDLGVNSFLIDVSELESVEYVADLSSLPMHYAEGRLNRMIHIALLMPKSKRAREAAQFYETICNNRGWPVRQFEKRDAAVAWLETNMSP